MEIARILSVVFNVLYFLILAHVVASWILPYENRARQLLSSLVDPLLQPIRNILPQGTGLDFSPLVLLVVLSLAQRLVFGLL